MTVTIEKWFDGTKYWYWVIDINGKELDGFSKKYQAINYIKNQGMIRKDKSVKIKK